MRNSQHPPCTAPTASKPHAPQHARPQHPGQHLAHGHLLGWALSRSRCNQRGATAGHQLWKFPTETRGSIYTPYSNWHDVCPTQQALGLELLQFIFSSNLFYWVSLGSWRGVLISDWEGSSQARHLGRARLPHSALRRRHELAFQMLWALPPPQSFFGFD